MRQVIATTLCSLLLVSAAAAQDPTWKRYVPGNTGPQGDYVLSVLVDPAGMVWVAANDPVPDQGGLARFDGNMWKGWSNVDTTCPDFELRALKRDSQGNIWAGSQIGLLKFDGASFTVYNQSNSGLPSDIVRGVDIDSAGNVWFAMNDFVYNKGGLGKFDGTSFQFWTRETGIPWPETWNGVECVACAPGGVVYIGSDVVGAAKYDGASWIYYDPNDSNPPPSNNIGDIDVAPDGAVWMCNPNSTGRNIGKLVGSTWTYYDPPGAHGTASITLGDGDSVWVATYGTGIWLRSHNTWTGIGWPGTHCYSIALHGSTLYAGGIGGLGIYRDGQWTLLNTQNSGLSNRWINGIDFDSDANAWIATAGGGICRFDGEKWMGFGPYNQGLYPWPYLTDNVNCAVDDGQGKVWVGTCGHGIVAWDGTNWVGQYLPTAEIKNIDRDSTGTLWAWGQSALYRFEGDSWRCYSYLNSPMPAYVTGVCADRDGYVWATNLGGLFLTDGTNWECFSPESVGMPGPGNCWSPARAPDGSLWLSVAMDPSFIKTALVRFRREDTSWVVYDSSNSPLPGAAQLGQVAVSSAGVVWASYHDEYYDYGGVARLDGTDWTFYTKANSPLPDDNIWSIGIDRNDNPWIGCVSEGVAIIYDNLLPVEENHKPQATSFRLRGYPNPFRDRVALRFAPTAIGLAGITVVDAAGRVVRTLRTTRGASSVSWDGRSDDGKEMSSGVYFARLQTASGITSAKVLLQR